MSELPSRNREEYDELLRALKRARDYLYNGFEPDNQSRAYHDVDATIKKGEQIRLTLSEKAKPESEEAKALIADAARYRWLKNAADVDVMDEILMQKIEEWDSLIDTQIAFDGVVPVRPERPEIK